MALDFDANYGEFCRWRTISIWRITRADLGFLANVARRAVQNIGGFALSRLVFGYGGFGRVFWGFRPSDVCISALSRGRVKNDA